MFPFDTAALPQLRTRKAFIGVDFQNDFISDNGALPVQEPEGFVERTVKLANVFRDFGDVVWVQSQFDSPQPCGGDLIITAEPVPLPKTWQTRRLKIPADLLESEPPDEEAFLSHEEPECVKPGTSGCALAPAIELALQRKDLKLTKTNYSAFQSTHLLHLLRAKMVMEVFICGSLTNVGVYATALDAASHGMAITIVHDCSGYREESRQEAAIKKLVELTGCEVASCEEVLEMIQPASKDTSKEEKVTSKAPEATGKPIAQEDDDARRKSLTPEIVKNMTGLRIVSNSPSPARQTQPPQAKASTTSSAERLDSTTEPPSNSEESHGNETSHMDQKQTEKADIGIDLKNSHDRDSEDEKKHQQSHQSSTSATKPANTPSPPSSNPTSDSTRIENKAMDNGSSIEIKSEGGQFLQRGLCEGNTNIIQGILPDSMVDGIFEKLREEVSWQRMSHQGGEVPRLVAVQGHVAEDGSIPVYRHPSDESPPLLPFSPTVQAIRAVTEKHLGHPLNHVLIQFYRDGSDYISEHSDKTLDIVKGSYIANVSLGAERTMIFRTKRLEKDPSRAGSPTSDLKRQIQRAKLPHNSLCQLDLDSNMKWLHAIRQDKRAQREKSAAELAFNSGRISLTFRQIGTFLNREETLIWGQGATGKTRDEACAVINGQTPEAIEMLKAFGTENRSSEFDWDVHYGKGFDVLHMSHAPRFFSSGDLIITNPIALMLSEFGVNYAKGSVTAGASSGEEGLKSENNAIKFVDKDKSVVQGGIATMLYLDSRYGAGKPGATPRTPPELALEFTRFQQALAFSDKCHQFIGGTDTETHDLKVLQPELVAWNGFIAESQGDFITGSKLSLPDFAFWPTLHALVEKNGMEVLAGYDNLKNYYDAVAERPSAKKATGRETKSSQK
ncbi:hypothetical protein BGZ63DRAFT_423962 [Mariannaea sp. PMI_226]|nr:hypothetical protein BGZ63DRAFT_423962 [Mariannaea sp. PMI_226]